MEVRTAIPQVAWNGHTKHNPNDTSLNNVKHSTLISTEYDCTAGSDNSNSNIPPPLSTTPPPDYYSGVESRSSSSGLQSGQESYSESGEFSVSPQNRACHSVTSSSTLETITQAKVVTERSSSNESDDDISNGEELDVLEQLKSSSTSKLIQLQQVHVREDNTTSTQESKTAVHLSSDNNAQTEIAQLRKV